MPVENHNAEHHPTTMATSDLVAIVTNPTTNPQIQLIRFDDFVATIGTAVIPPFTYADYNDSRITGAAQKSANLSDLANLTTAKSNLGMANVQNIDITTWAGSAYITQIGTLTSGTVPVARISGLGDAATKNTGTTAGTVAAGDDSRFNVLNSTNRVTFSDADVPVIATTTRVLAQIGSLTAARTVTLPLANTMTAGVVLRVIDESGTITAANTITVTTQGSDRINASLTQVVINIPNGWMDFEVDGNSKWTYRVDQVASPTVQNNINVESMYNPANPAFAGGAQGNGADDTAALTACLTAAAAANGTVYIPFTMQISSTILIPTAGFKQPNIVSINTSTSTVTLSQDPGGNNGDPIQFGGACPTGIARGTVYYRYFPNTANRTQIILYDTRIHALAGGSTGKIVLTQDVRVTGTLSGSTLTISAGTEVATEDGTAIIGPTGRTGYVIAGGGSGTLTMDLSYNTGAGTYTYACYVDNRSFDGGLKIVGAPGAYLKKHPTWTSTVANALIKAAVGSNVEIHGLGFEGLSSQFVPSGVTATVGTLDNAQMIQSVTISGATDWALPGVAFSFEGGQYTYYVQSVSGSTLTMWRMTTGTAWPAAGTYKVGQGISSGVVGLTVASASAGATSVVLNDTKGLVNNLTVYFAGDTAGHLITNVNTASKTITFNTALTNNLTNAACTSVGGDDGLDVESVQNALIEHCFFRHCGDSALRICSNPGYYQGKTESLPDGGVSTTQIVVRDCDFYNVYQTSTTASNQYMVGGARDVLFENNKFSYLRGSVKFASRTAGAKNIHLIGNIITSSDNHGFEIDTSSDLFIERNTIMNTFNQGIFMLPNNGLTNNAVTATTTASSTTIVVSSSATLKVGMILEIAGVTGQKKITNITDGTHIVVDVAPDASVSAAAFSIFGLGIQGSAFNGLYVKHNIFDNCGMAQGALASIRISPDSYADGFKWDYRDVHIIGNIFRNVTNTSNVAVNVVNGSFVNFRFEQNDFENHQGANLLKMLLRSSTTSGFINSISVKNNNFAMSNASTTAVDIRGSIGTVSVQPTVNEIDISSNLFTGTCTRSILLENVSNVMIKKNRMNLTAGTYFLANNTFGYGQISNVVFEDNDMETTNTFGYSLTGISGLRIIGNRHKIATGTSTASIANSCSSVVYLNNLEIGGTPNFNQIPVCTRSQASTLRQEEGTAVPSTGTWLAGSKLILTNATLATTEWLCTVGGTFGSPSGPPTATTDGSTNVVTFSSMAAITVGCFINVAGAWTGSRQVLAVDNVAKTGVVSGTVPSAASGAAVTYVSPTFVRGDEIPYAWFPFSNASYSALSTDKVISQTGVLTAARVVTLPTAASVPAGYQLIIQDVSGTVTAPNAIQVARNGSDTLNGGTAVRNMTTPYCREVYVSDGVSNWTTPNISATNGVTFSDADYAATVTDRQILQIGTLTAARTVTLPAASSIPRGTQITISDDSGTCTATNTIVIARQGSDGIHGLVSINISTPYGSRTLECNGSNKWTIVSKSGPSTKTVTTAYTATISDSLILADATGGAFSVTLPTAVARNGAEFTVKKIDSSGNAVTIATTSAQTIDGAATKSLPSQYNSARCVSDNANWWLT